jgi:pimeloyl-ACP methyl ester carboxylesterase
MTQPEAIVQTARVTVHGHRITYREADDPRDPVLLLVHGITSSSANSDPVIPAFTERTHLLAPDLLNPLQKPSTINFKIHKY